MAPAMLINEMYNTMPNNYESPASEVVQVTSEENVMSNVGKGGNNDVKGGIEQIGYEEL